MPYDLVQYSSFKKEIKVIADKYGARYVNLENLVPAEWWGTKAATTIGGGEELDFMHFQAGGHKLLADTLLTELLLMLDEKSSK